MTMRVWAAAEEAFSSVDRHTSGVARRKRMCGPDLGCSLMKNQSRNIVV